MEPDHHPTDHCPPEKYVVQADSDYHQPVEPVDGDASEVPHKAPKSTCLPDNAQQRQLGIEGHHSQQKCQAMSSEQEGALTPEQDSHPSQHTPPVLTRQILEDHEVPDLPDTLTMTLIQQKGVTQGSSGNEEGGDEGGMSEEEEEDGMRSNESLLADITEFLLEHNEQSATGGDGDNASHSRDDGSHKNDKASRSMDNTSHSSDNASHCSDNASNSGVNASHYGDNVSHCGNTVAQPTDIVTHSSDSVGRAKENATYRCVEPQHIKEVVSSTRTSPASAPIIDLPRNNSTASVNSSKSSAMSSKTLSSHCGSRDVSPHPLLMACGGVTVPIVPDQSKGDGHSQQQGHLFNPSSVYSKIGAPSSIKKKSSKHKQGKKSDKNDLKHKAWKSRLKEGGGGEKRRKESKRNNKTSSSHNHKSSAALDGNVKGSTNNDRTLTARMDGDSSHPAAYLNVNSVTSCVASTALTALSNPHAHTSSQSQDTTAPVKRKPGRPPKKKPGAMNQGTAGSLQKSRLESFLFPSESKSELSGRHDSRNKCGPPDMVQPQIGQQAEALLRLDHIASNRSPDSGIVSINGSPADQESPPSPIAHNVRDHFGISNQSDHEGPPVLENENEVPQLDNGEPPERPVLEPVIPGQEPRAKSSEIPCQTLKRQRKSNVKYTQETELGYKMASKHKRKSPHKSSGSRVVGGKVKRPVGRPRKHPLPEVKVKGQRGRPKGTKNSKPKALTATSAIGGANRSKGVPTSVSGSASYWGFLNRECYQSLSLVKLPGSANPRGLSMDCNGKPVAPAGFVSHHNQPLTVDGVPVKRKRGRPRKNPLPMAQPSATMSSVLDQSSKVFFSSQQHQGLSISVAAGNTTGLLASRPSADSCSSSSSLGPPVLSPALSPMLPVHGSSFPFNNLPSQWAGSSENRLESDQHRGNSVETSSGQSKPNKICVMMRSNHKRHKKKAAETAAFSSQSSPHIHPHISSSALCSRSLSTHQSQPSFPTMDNPFGLAPRLPLLPGWSGLPAGGLGLSSSHSGGLAATTMLALSSLEQDVTLRTVGQDNRSDPKNRTLFPGGHSPGIKFGSAPSSVGTKDAQLDFRSDDSSCGKRKKKKSKHFKSKHKNIIDPVFLAEIENLNRDMTSLSICETGVNSMEGEALTCFGSVTQSPLATFTNLKAIKTSHKGNKKLNSPALHSPRPTPETSHRKQTLPVASETELDSTDDYASLPHRKTSEASSLKPAGLSQVSPTTSSSSSVISRMEDVLSATLSKRGPGRPRKHPLPFAPASNSKSPVGLSPRQVSPGHRGRGRPPNKTPTSAKNLSSPGGPAASASCALPSTDDSSSDSEPDDKVSVPPKHSPKSSQPSSPRCKVATFSTHKDSKHVSPKSMHGKSPKHQASQDKSPGGSHSGKSLTKNSDGRSKQNNSSMASPKLSTGKTEKKSSQKARKKKKKSKKLFEEQASGKKGSSSHTPSKKESKKHKKKKRKNGEKHSHDGGKRRKGVEKMSVEVSTDMGERNRTVQADSEIQVDMDAGKIPTKRKNVDVGIQVDPEEMMLNAIRSSDARISSEVGIQACNEGSGMQPLEIQVDFGCSSSGTTGDKSNSNSFCSTSSKQSSMLERWMSPQVPCNLYQTAATSPRSPLLLIQRHLAAQSAAAGGHPMVLTPGRDTQHYPVLINSGTSHSPPKPCHHLLSPSHPITNKHTAVLNSPASNLYSLQEIVSPQKSTPVSNTCWEKPVTPSPNKTIAVHHVPVSQNHTARNALIIHQHVSLMPSLNKEHKSNTVSAGHEQIPLNASVDQEQISHNVSVDQEQLAHNISFHQEAIPHDVSVHQETILHKTSDSPKELPQVHIPHSPMHEITDNTLQNQTGSPNSSIHREIRVSCSACIEGSKSPVQIESSLSTVSPTPCNVSQNFPRVHGPTHNSSIIKKSSVTSQHSPETENPSPISQPSPATQYSSPISQHSPATQNTSPISQHSPATQNTSPISQHSPATQNTSPISQHSPATQNTSTISQYFQETQNSTVYQHSSDTQNASPISQNSPETRNTSPISQNSPETKNTSPISQNSPETRNTYPISQISPETRNTSLIPHNSPETRNTSPISQNSPETKNTPISQHSPETRDLSLSHSSSGRRASVCQDTCQNTSLPHQTNISHVTMIQAEESSLTEYLSVPPEAFLNQALDISTAIPEDQSHQPPSVERGSDGSSDLEGSEDSYGGIGFQEEGDECSEYEAPPQIEKQLNLSTTKHISQSSADENGGQSGEEQSRACHNGKECDEVIESGEDSEDVAVCGASEMPAVGVHQPPVLSIPVMLPIAFQSYLQARESELNESIIDSPEKIEYLPASQASKPVVISPSSDSENNYDVQIATPPPGLAKPDDDEDVKEVDTKDEPDQSVCVILDSEHDVIVVDDDEDEDDGAGGIVSGGEDSCTEVTYTTSSRPPPESSQPISSYPGHLCADSAASLSAAHNATRRSSKGRTHNNVLMGNGEPVRSDSECVVVVDRLGEDELRRHQVVLPGRHRKRYLSDSEEEELTVTQNNNHKVSKLAKKRFFVQQKKRRHSDPESSEAAICVKPADVSAAADTDLSVTDAGQLPEADQPMEKRGYSLDDSLDTTTAGDVDTTTDDLDVSLCSLTNSECDPLPLQQLGVPRKKKRRPLQDDMGYSRPRRKRRKKKKLESLDITRDSGTDEYHQLGSTFTECSGLDTADEGDLSTAPSTPSHASSTPSHASSGYPSGYPSSVSGTSTPVRQGPITLPSLILKKRYQKAGLYSNSYKDDPIDKPKKLSRKTMTYVASDHEFGLLPPPIHCGRYMREKRIDFKLPYDIWFLYTNHMLQPHKMPSPKYRKIRNNVYVDAKPVCRDWEPHACNCKPPYEEKELGCGDNCLNRMVYTECSSSTCPCGPQCDNQRIQQHRWTEHLVKFVTPDRGHGVRCTDSVPAGQMISEYVGEVVSEEEFRRRMTEDYANSSHHYCLHLDAGTVIDGYRAGNITRFVNHSCQPNCEMQKWNVNGVYRIALFSLRDILAGEELTYDYNFHCFNMDAQQICMCGSDNCRGVVGGKGQRLNGHSNQNKGQNGSQTKDKRKKKKTKKNNDGDSESRQATPSKPMSHRERCFAQKHAIFLLRNIQRVKQLRQNHPVMSTPWSADSPATARSTPTNSTTDVFKTQYTALKTSRSVRTRGLALAEEHVEVIRVARLAQVLKLIYSTLLTYKDENDIAPAEPLMHVPAKRRNPDYYQLIEEPIDLTTIEKNILSGHYNNLDGFDHDVNLLFRNVERYCGKKSEIGEGVGKLRKVYGRSLETMSGELEEVLGPDSCSLTAIVHSKPEEVVTACEEGMVMEQGEEAQPEDMEGCESGGGAMEEEEEEEVIHCVCNIVRDEGLMIQCDKCKMWQHCDCMGVCKDVEHYTCEQCDPRGISPEVAMIPQPTDPLPGCSYYMTLVKEDLTQIRIGECVYVLRESDQNQSSDGASGEESESLKEVRLSADLGQRDNLDIFRVERLWKNENEEKFAFGHYYLRPQETFHEPSRKFFPNEVFRVPIYEIVPLETVVGRCCVIDLSTFCKGRPKGVSEQDIYICEYRLDKTAHFFYKIVRTKWPINTKRYNFDRFERRLQPKRTFSPHEVPDQYRKKGESEGRLKSSDKSAQGPSDSEEDDFPLSKVKAIKIEEKKARINEIMNRLLAPIPVKNRLDATYLLEGVCGKRVRKKTTLCSM